MRQLTRAEHEALRSLGRHLRSLRRARKLTQEQLASRSELAADTIRRMEAGSFAASFTTIRRVCAGLQLSLTTFCETFELGDRVLRQELLDLLMTRTDREIELATRTLEALFGELDAS